jgi:hypothetical protein
MAQTSGTLAHRTHTTPAQSSTRRTIAKISIIGGSLIAARAFSPPVGSVRRQEPVILPVESEFAQQYPTPQTQRDAAITAGKHFIEDVPSDVIVAMGDAVSTDFVRSSGLVLPAPVFISEYGIVHLAQDGSSMPNQTIIGPRISDTSMLILMQGIPLARVDYVFEYLGPNGSPQQAMLAVGLLGFYAGNPASRGLTLVNLGFRTGDVDTCDKVELRVRPVDAGHFQILGEGGQNAVGTPTISPDVAKAWDNNRGTSVAYIVAGSPRPPEDISAKMIERGFPGELGTLEYMTARFNRSKELIEIMQEFLLTKAVQLGYACITENGDEIPVPEAFPQIKPLADGDAYTQRLDNLRRQMLPLWGVATDERANWDYMEVVGKVLDQERLLPDLTSQLADIGTMVISPTSAALGEGS